MNAHVHVEGAWSCMYRARTHVFVCVSVLVENNALNHYVNLYHRISSDVTKA